MNKKVLIWNFVFQYGYVLTNIFNSIILLPFYIKYIDSSTLGIWLATGNILNWITLTDPGIGDVLQQRIAELKGKKLFSDVGKTISSGFFASSIILIISILVGFVFYFLLGAIIDKDVTIYPHLQTALMLSIIAIGLSLTSFSMSGINQGLHNSANVAIATILANILFLITNLILLFNGFGVISIAFSNLVRSVFINIYNILSMRKAMNRESILFEFDFVFFKKFIKIFSFTSISRIITGLSGSIDMIILARFIPPSMITIYEINKRPINMTSGLIGRHSVALMPLVSHENGTGNNKTIITFISKQFRIYCYAALFASFLFWLTYKDLISLWTGKEKYAGDTIMHLLVINFFFGLIGYFMSNMGYALGDIKMNSIINIIKGIVLAILMYFVANRYGIVGTLVAGISVALVSDFFFFSYRLYKLGFIKNNLLKDLLSCLLFLVPICLLAVWGCNLFVNKLFIGESYLPKILVGGFIFSTLYFITILIFDNEIRMLTINFKNKILNGYHYKIKGI